MRLAAHGIALELPRGWHGRIFRRAGAPPTVHAANFELPPDDGDFGSGATERMPDGGAFLALKEYEAGPRLHAGQGLFESGSIPLPLDTRQFGPRRLQVGRRGQAGMQHFFTASGRPFCLYAVVKAPGAVAHAAAQPEQVRSLSHVLSTLTIDRLP